MYQLVFENIEKGRLVEEGGPWHPDEATARKWRDFFIAHGFSPKEIGIRKPLGDGCYEWVEGRKSKGGISNMKEKVGGDDAVLMAALANMA